MAGCDEWCDEDDALGWTIGLVSGLVSCVLLRELCSPVLSVERSESYNVYSVNLLTRIYAENEVRSQK